MRIQDIMSRTIKSCRPETNLAVAATLMWEGDCGVIPVVDEEGKAVGVITDRDICIAVATRGRRADEISVGEVMGGKILCCAPENDPQVALQIMRENKIHRLPVTNSEGRLVGMISINDMILEAREGKGRKSEGPSFADVMETLKAICGHRESMVAAA